MTTRHIAILAAALLAASCGGDSPVAPGDHGALQVERFEEDGIPVVRNVSGSAWDGHATLDVIQEIGVAEGDERYMFRRPWPYWVTEDEIFVLEPDDGRVRVYGYDGIHRRDIGRPGQGPGELEDAFRLAVTPDDQVVVASIVGAMLKLSFFTLGGAFVEAWTLGEGAAEDVLPSPEVLLPLRSSIVVSVARRPENVQAAARGTERGFQVAAGGALTGEPWLVPPLPAAPPTYVVDLRGQPLERAVPWGIRQAAVGILPTGEYLWSHRSEYRFHIVDSDGAAMAVERVAEPIPVLPEEAEYRRKNIVESTRRRQPEFNWDGEGIPDQALHRSLPVRSRRQDLGHPGGPGSAKRALYRPGGRWRRGHHPLLGVPGDLRGLRPRR